MNLSQKGGYDRLFFLGDLFLAILSFSNRRFCEPSPMKQADCEPTCSDDWDIITYLFYLNNELLGKIIDNPDKGSNPQPLSGGE